MKRLFEKLLIIALVLVLTNSCKKSVVSDVEDNVAIKNSKLTVESNPTGAQIYINNKNSGFLTPSTISWLRDTIYSVKLRLDLYEDTTFTVPLVDMQETKLFIDFTQNSKNFGNINCQSTPTESDIYLNDVFTYKKTTSLLKKLLPGNYEVKYKYKFHRDDSVNVIVKSNTTTDVNISLEDTSKWVSYLTSNSGIISSYIKCLECDKIGNVWIGTDVGLQKFNGKQWITYKSSNSILKTNIINALKFDSNGKLWIATENGLYSFFNEVFEDYSSILPNERVTAIKESNKGTIWIGTRNGLLEFGNGVNRIFTTQNSGLKDNSITAIEIDNNNNIWVGGLYNGISVFDETNWIYFNSSNIKVGVTIPDFAESIFKASDGKIWVSFLDAPPDKSYLLTYDGTNWVRITNNNISNRVYAIIEGDNYLLFPTKYGLTIFRNNYFIRYYDPNIKISLFRNQAAAIDSKGNIWLGTFMNGMAKGKKGNF